MEINIGDIVKMSDDIKLKLISNGCEEHVSEFGHCEGIVIGYSFDDVKDYLEVRWKPSNLKYGYDIKELIKQN